MHLRIIKAEWAMMKDEWQMMKDEWQMMNEERQITNDEWFCQSYYLIHSLILSVTLTHMIT